MIAANTPTISARLHEVPGDVAVLTAGARVPADGRPLGPLSSGCSRS
jgi:hypothetical protein